MKNLKIALISLCALVSLALSLGETAPDVSAPNQDGKTIKLSDYHGKPVLLYFYPKDDTPGCTKEACEFRDNYAKFQKAGVVILGVSRQDAASHRAFRQKHKLPFDLLTDEDGSFAKALEVGRMPLIGFHKRRSILIDAQGKFARFYQDVDPKTHTQQVLIDLESLGVKR